MENKGETKKLTQEFKKIKGLMKSYRELKIKGGELQSFFSKTKNLNNFIEKYGLNNDEHTKKIIRDVVDSMSHKEKDIKESTIIKFDKFTELLNESVIPSGDIDSYNFEKVLADYFNTSSMHVDLIDEKNHLFTVKDFGTTIKVICFSSEEFETMKSNILSKVKEEIFMSNVSVSTIDNTSIPILTFKISDIFQEDIDLSGLINDSHFFRIITSIMRNFSNINISRSKPEIFQGFYIWELIDSES